MTSLRNFISRSRPAIIRGFRVGRERSSEAHRAAKLSRCIVLVALAAMLSPGLGSFFGSADVERAAYAHTRITTDINWSEEVRQILRQHCMRCHNPSGIAPSYVDLTTYGTDSSPGARAWAAAIEEELQTGRMPPWEADRRWDHFANSRSMTQLEIDKLVAWVQGGAPQGPRRNLPPPAEFGLDEWELGAPDVVFELPEPFVLEADQQTATTRVRLPIQIEVPIDEATARAAELRGGEPGVAETIFASGGWVTAFEFRTDAPQTVYRIAAYVDDSELEAESLELEVQVPYDPFADEDAPEPTRLREAPRGRHLLGQWLRGDAPTLMPDGAGKRLRNGATLELEVEYRRSNADMGGEVRDRSRLGIYLAQTVDEVEKLVEQGRLEAAAAGAGDTTKKKRRRAKRRGGRGAAEAAAPALPSVSTVAALELEENVRLIGIAPSIPDGASSVEVRAIYPDQRALTLLYVPEFSGTWPSSYQFNEEVTAPAGTRLELRAALPAEADASAAGAWVDWVLDDHLVLPEPIIVRESLQQNRGGMMTDVLGGANTGALGAGESAPPGGAPVASVNDPNAAAHMDHSPLHGGQFFMAENMFHHLEGTLPIPGEFRFFVYDDFKEPVDPRNFKGEVVFEHWDEASGDFSEERFPLEPVAGTDFMVARFPEKVEFPVELFASVWLAGEQSRYDFFFTEVTKEQAVVPVRRVAAGAGAHSHDRPPIVIPATAEGIVAEIAIRRDRVSSQIEAGDWPTLYVPAFDGRELAEALLGRLGGLSARDTGAARRAITKILQGAGELDRAGDLEDAARARRAFERFNEGVRTLESTVKQ